MIKKMWKIVKIISLFSACIATISFIKERIEYKKNKTYIHRTFGIYEKYFKRPLDVFLSTGAFIVLSPLLVFISILVKIKLGSPVIFTQERPGRIDPQKQEATVFKLYKFRTMTDDRDKDGCLLSDSERLTDFGKRLRSTSLDELPELINIIKGDMSIVGPRPLLVRYLKRYSKKQARRHEVRPGFTGLAQINGRNSISWEDKFEWDIKYVDNISFINDCKIIIDTIKTVIKQDGINAAGEATMSEFMG